MGIDPLSNEWGGKIYKTKDEWVKINPIHPHSQFIHHALQTTKKYWYTEFTHIPTTDIMPRYSFGTPHFECKTPHTYGSGAWHTGHCFH